VDISGGLGLRNQLSVPIPSVTVPIGIDPRSGKKRKASGFLKMDRNEILEYITQQVELLQQKAVELQERHDDIEKQLNAYKQLLRMYRGVYESESGVGMQNRLPSEIMEIIQKKFTEEETCSQKKRKRKTRRRRKLNK
jgi:hypothetical protein